MKTITITRKCDGFNVQTDTLLSDGTFRAAFCKLKGNRLVQSGFHMGGGFVTVNLSKEGLARIASLKDGESTSKSKQPIKLNNFHGFKSDESLSAFTRHITGTEI